MLTQPKMDAEVVLRQVAAAADHFARLHQVAGYGSHAGVQSQTIALDPLQLKADPVIPRAALGTQNHRPAYQILHHRFELAIVEEVAHCQSTADLRNLDGRSGQLADVGKPSIPLIQKQQLGLKVLEPGMKAVDLGIYMSVDQEKILPAIVVEIDKRISPPHISSGALRNSRSNRDISKSQVPVIAIEGGILVVKVRNQQRHAPGMQKVAQGYSHIGLGSAIGVERHAGRKTDIHEFSCAIPLIKIVRLAVVCDQKIQFAVMVKVRPDRRQAIAVLRITHARFLGNISEGSIPVVVVQIVRRSLQAARAALHIDAQVFAGVARTECRHIVQAKIHVVGDEEVVPAVAVIISKGCSRGPLGVAAQPGAFGHVGKGAIAIVAIEHHPTKTGHQQVRPPVVVVVPYHRPHGPAGISHAGLVRYVRKCPIAIVVIEGAACLPAVQSHIHALGVGEINVRPAIAVIIDQRHASAHRFHNEFLFRAGKMFELNAGRSGNVHQLRIAPGRPVRSSVGQSLCTFMLRLRLLRIGRLRLSGPRGNQT